MLMSSAHVDDVRAIVQRAVKDLAIEKSLKTYEEVWLSKLFELRIHIRSKGVEQGDANINVSSFTFMGVVYTLGR